MAEGVLFNISEQIIIKLGSLAAQEVALWSGFKDELIKLKGTVSRIKAVLDDAAEQALRQNNQVKDWLGKLREALYDAEDLLDGFSTEVQRKQLVCRNRVSGEVRVFFSRSNQFVYGFRMGHKVKALRKRLADIDADSKQFSFEPRDEEKASLTMVRELATSSEPEIVIGRDVDIKTIIAFVFNSNYEENVSVISIVGIGGLGKTTLAQHVFNNEHVKENFGELRLWVSVSSGLDVSKVLKGAIGSKGDSDRLESLKNDLERKIKDRKYLLVLDDLWDGEDDGVKWDRLRELLPRTARGSKIVITTRSHRIAELTSTVTPHPLEGLSEDGSWYLFERIAFPHRQESNHSVNAHIRREIVERCCGVPLVIKSIARLMSLKDRAQWLSFITHELPLSVHDDNIVQTLKLSYDPLPSYMKHCFSYCSLFPKGHRIEIESLIQLWIAQGFFSSSSPGESLEIAGLRCFNNLMWKSFFHTVENDDLGNVESCKMHDFMHDLATKVAGLESTKVDCGGNRISDLARHVSFEIELDLSQQIPIPFATAKHLRTLILLGGKWNEGAWESICRDFRLLRVLDLHGNLGIKEVSPLIEKLELLKYLDLSNNKMEALPDSITNLINLQVLKLNNCRRLEELPRDIDKLISLRHLDVGCSRDHDLCESLEYMPFGIGKLTSLQTLSCFVVAKKSRESKMVGGLDELRGLNELRGRLEIRVWGYERDSCISEFERAKLIEKQHLQRLAIRWDYRDSDIDFCDEMLQSLQPNLDLQVLEARRGGMRFPSWLSHRTNLVRISLNQCHRCEEIPPLQGLLSLKELWVDEFDRLEYIDSEGVGGGGGGVSTFFPSLKKLDIRRCDSLKGWWKKSDDSNYDSDESTTTAEEELTMLCFPRLSYLYIFKCPKLSSMPLFPTLDDELRLYWTSSVPLQQTMKVRGWKSTSSVSSSSSSSSSMLPLSYLKELHIGNCEDVESLPKDGLRNLSSLRTLHIDICPRLKSLSLPDKGMHSLQKLEIWFCRELRSLSQSQRIPYLPYLQQLRIWMCNEELNGRLREGKAAEECWLNIKHISNIIIDEYYIQKDGRYVKKKKWRYL